MTTNSSQELRERLAEVQHEIWAHWMRYLFSVGTVRVKDGAHIIHSEDAKRWTRQTHTPYNELSKKEKESDRHQADKVLTVFQTQIEMPGQELTKERDELAAMLEDCRDSHKNLHAGVADLVKRLNQQTVECNRLRVLIHKVASSFRNAATDEESYKACCLAFAALLREDESD